MKASLSWLARRGDSSAPCTLRRFLYSRAIIRPASDRDQGAINDHLLVDEFASGQPDVGFEVWIASHSPACHVTCSQEKQRTMAIRGDRLFRHKKMADDRHGFRTISQIFGSSASGQHESVIARRRNLIEPEI